jgi:hypothetical protein
VVLWITSCTKAKREQIDYELMVIKLFVPINYARDLIFNINHTSKNIMALELRWFFQEKVPEEINRWFNKDLKNEEYDLEKDSYQDIYLFNPEVNYSSIKFRNENFVIKWRSNTFPINIKLKNVDIVGNTEDWIFWYLKDYGASKEIQLYIDKNYKHPWIKINKKRQKIPYKILNNQKEFLVLEDDISKADCSIELSTVVLDKNKDISWWTIAIELLKKTNTSNDNTSNKHESNDWEKQIFEKISKTFLKNYPYDNLLAIRSYGYPQLFSLYQNLIKS